jgi:hypothetical protein
LAFRIGPSRPNAVAPDDGQQAGDDVPGQVGRTGISPAAYNKTGLVHFGRHSTIRSNLVRGTPEIFEALLHPSMFERRLPTR